MTNGFRPLPFGIRNWLFFRHYGLGIRHCIYWPEAVSNNYRLPITSNTAAVIAVTPVLSVGSSTGRN